eukprot:3871299-Prymnesium_polylepis.1
MILELRLSHPGEYMPTEAERASSVLVQYVEIYEVFKDEAFVTTAQVHSLFRGELCLDRKSGQTAFEKAGPELWLALTKLLGYPSKPLRDYHGQFCVDHVVERSLYSRSENRSVKTPADTLLNYGMLIDAFNTADKMKSYGMEKRMWYTERFSSMARVAMGFRLDFCMAQGRMPTTAEFVKSTVCKEAWQPSMMLLGRDHPVHRLARKRKTQGSLDGFVSSSRVGSAGVPNCVGEATVASVDSTLATDSEAVGPREQTLFDHGRSAHSLAGVDTEKASVELATSTDGDVQSDLAVDPGMEDADAELVTSTDGDAQP